MDFEKRAVDSYQFVLKDLKSADKFLINALTMLALDDVEYHKAIADAIVQHIFSVINKYFLRYFSFFHI